jgi:hypothetical protein
MSNLIPGELGTYIYNTEKDYYNEYKESYFAITKKKGGWDCMRHYEIIANGCVPYFYDIENCPPNTMFLCPKKLFVEGNKLCEKFADKKIEELTEEIINEYNILREKLLNYTRTYLTTKKIAEYILEKTKFDDNNIKILFLSGCIQPDYLRCVTLHGFKTLIGLKCHDYPKVPHVYKSDSINYEKLYGKGITYTNLLDKELHDNELDKKIVEDIKNKYYDIVIYGSYHRGMPFYDIVCKSYKANEIILLCGEDIHNCNYDEYVKKGHNVFVRELV